MQNNAWYKTWFNSQYYLDLYKHRDTTDAKKIISLLFKNIKLKRGSKILDLACGNGRHSILFAKRGYNVTGIDLSGYLILHAKKKLKNEYEKFKDNLKFEIKDMRDIEHVSEFDMVVNLFTSFGYFIKHSDNQKVIKGISSALKPGGYFIFDFLNSIYLKKNLVQFDTTKFDSKAAVQVRAIVNDTVIKEIYIISARKPKHYYPDIAHYTEKIKLYTIDDIEKMFIKYGLKIEKKFGDYNGSQFHKNRSKRLIIIAKKSEILKQHR
jgi:SAM-dependent methyltransferase